MWDPWANARTSDELLGRLKWFLLGRLAVISCFLGVVALSYLRSGREGYDVSINRLLFTIAATYAFSLVSALVLPRLKRLKAFTHFQIAFDILLTTGVIYLTGGVDSPFGFLYSLPIINGAVLLFGAGALVSALFAALTYDALMVALANNLLSPVHLLPQAQMDVQIVPRLVLMNVTFFLIAHLAGILTRRLHNTERLLSEKQAERDHLVLLQSTLAKTIGSTLVTTDPEGRVTSADRSVERLIDRSGAEIVGTDIGAIFSPLRLTPSARLRFLQSTVALEPIEFSHTIGDGQAFHVRCVAAPLKDTYGHSIGALFVLQDVTDLKDLESPSAPLVEIEAMCRDELEEAAEVADVADGLLGVSRSIQQIRETIDRVSGSDTTVLITGESGTGKEVVARAIHSRGARREKPFVAINCGAIPEHLMESELFGHVRGAFTGAVADRPGCFRAANGGTIFLDEIGELPPHLQVKLLRILQERIFRPVGSETCIAVNVRIIAASNRELAAEVKAGRFREDLFYRINVITIDLPPLRERRDDIPLLIRHFLRQFSDLHRRHVNRFSVGAGRILLEHHFPGNVRELENILEHAVALCDGDTATEEHLPSYLLNGRQQRPAPSSLGTALRDSEPSEPATVSPPARETVDLERDLAEYEKAILRRALDEAGGVKKRAAELLGINYRSLRHRLQKYGLSDICEEPVPLNDRQKIALTGPT